MIWLYRIDRGSRVRWGEFKNAMWLCDLLWSLFLSAASIVTLEAMKQLGRDV